MRKFTKLLVALALTVVAVGGAKANRYLVYNNGTAGANDYERQAICKFNSALTLGQQYVIKAKIKVENPNPDPEIKIGFNINDGVAYPNTKTSYGAAIVPTAEFVEYTWYYTPSDWDPAQFVFNTGKFGGKIYIDDVSCTPTGGSTEFVDNGNFNSTDISNWTNNYQGPSYTIDSDFSDADFVMVYNNGTAGANDYERQAICKFNSALTLGQQYVIKAKIKVENPNPDPEIKIGFNINDGVAYPNTKTSYGAAIVPTAEFVEYTWYYTPSDWDPAQFVFNTGKFGGKIYIDDVSCTPTGGSTEFVDNGNFNSTDISNWTNNYQGPSYTRWDYDVSAIVGADGYATFSADKAINVDGIVAAYSAKCIGTSLVLKSETKIPAKAGVIIEAAAGTYTIPAVNTAAAIADNDLKVSDGFIIGNSSTIYALANRSHGVGFYRVKTGVTIPAGKVYLDTSTPGAPDFLGFDGGETTSISELNVKGQTDGEFYNLAGQRVAQPTKGLYIVNGKKVVIK